MGKQRLIEYNVMQGERGRKSKYLFEVDLEEDEVEALVHLQNQLLKSLLARCSRTFKKHMAETEAANTFLRNYQLIMELHSEVVANAQSVNLCLHFALLYSEFLLFDGQQSEARAILKQTCGYVDIQGIDSILMGACLSNLSCLYLRGGKVYKCLSTALRGINIIEGHLQRLKDRRERGRIVEDVVVFVNLLIVAQSVLKKIIKVCSKTFFKSLFKIVNRLGYSFANKYLGSQSLFTKKFSIPEDSVNLPVYESEKEDEEEEGQELKEFEVRIANQLDNIYKVLKELNLEPEVFYIRQHIIENKNKTQSSIISIDVPQTPETPPPEFSVCYEQIFNVGGWELDISIFREPTNLMVTKMGEQYVGHIQIKLGKGKKSANLTIPEDKFVKVMNCLNFQDILPYEYDVRTLNSDQFFKKAMFHFLSVSVDGQVDIRPRAITSINPFQKKFCGEQSIVLVNHVYFRNFRTAICPRQTSQTVYLDILFRDKKLYEEIQLVELQHIGIARLRKNYSRPNDAPNEYLKLGKLKKVTILHPEDFRTRIYTILDKFQSFLSDQDSDVIDQLTMTNIEDSLKYYKYVEEGEGKGRFYQLRYRYQANFLEIYCRNNFMTYTPEGLAYAKGNITISPQSFLKDFGVALKSVKKWLPAFYNILIQKYDLKVFKQPISEIQEDRFQQNAINQLQFVSKFFKRKLIGFEDYMLPLTVQLLSIGTADPVGLRVTAYQPIKGINVGLFILINLDYWQRAQLSEKQLNENESANFEKSKGANRFGFKKEYFLTQWLVDEGFNKIFSRLAINNRSLEMKGMSGKFYRLQDLI